MTLNTRNRNKTTSEFEVKRIVTIEGFTFFLARNAVGSWSWYEKQTGGIACNVCLYREAKKELTTKIECIGVDRFRKAIDKAIDKYGIVNPE